QGTIAVYVNGYSGTPNTVGSFTPETTLDFYIGHRPIYGQEFFKGSIDELTVYNKALSASEVLSIFTAGVGGKCKSTSLQSVVTQSMIVLTNGHTPSLYLNDYTIPYGYPTNYNTNCWTYGLKGYSSLSCSNSANNNSNAWYQTPCVLVSDR